MSYSDIRATPLDIDLRFVMLDRDSPPPSSHPLRRILAFVLPLLPEDAGKKLAETLTKPLDELFHDAWAEMQAMVRAQVTQAILEQRPRAYDLDVGIPARGTLRAQAGNLSSGLLDTLPPGTRARQLTLSYQVPDFRIAFAERTTGIWGAWADPSYIARFDGEIEIAIAVPDDPRIPLGVRVHFHTWNQRGEAGNFFAIVKGLWEGLGDLLPALWRAMQGQPTPRAPDSSVTPVHTKKLIDLFGELSKGFASTFDLGFHQLGVDIVTTPEGDAIVQFALTHAFDPAPAVWDPIARENETPSFFRPAIAAGVPQVHAGDLLRVDGSSFPAARATRLEIEWTDSTSGKTVESEVQWGAAPGGVPPSSPRTEILARAGRYDGRNRFTATGLVPQAQYAFRVRDCDVARFIGSAWSDWLLASTNATDDVVLVLPDLNVTLGPATVQRDGTFVANVVIPASVPAGLHVLAAMQSGQRMAQTTITVATQGTVFEPKLQIISPDTNQPYEFPAIVVDQGWVRVRGSSFLGGAVDLIVDGNGPVLGTAVADGNGGFSATVSWPQGVYGAHDVVARQGGKEARAAVRAIQPPR